MKSRLVLNLALAALLLGLGLFAWFHSKTAPQPAYRLSAQAPATATRIVLSRPGQPELKLEKGPSGWRLTAPFAARADSPAVDRLLTLLAATSTRRFPADDPARFGLDQPMVRLAIDNQEFIFGTQQPVTGEQYVATGGSVYLVASRYLADALQPATNLASKHLFGHDEIPTGIELGRAETVPPKHWLQSWREATSLVTQPYAGAKSRGQIRVRLANGAALSLAILQREPELVLLRADEKLQYHFPLEAGKRLLNPAAN